MASVVGATGAPSISSDAKLIDLCADFDALERKMLAAFDGVTTDVERADAVQEAVADEQAPILDAICACRPSTLAGFQALAGSLALWDAELLKKGGEGHCTDDRLLAALVRGLTGSAAA